jgi:hypothetical protein
MPASSSPADTRAGCGAGQRRSLCTARRGIQCQGTGGAAFRPLPVAGTDQTIPATRSCAPATCPNSLVPTSKRYLARARHRVHSKATLSHSDFAMVDFVGLTQGGARLKRDGCDVNIDLGCIDPSRVVRAMSPPRIPRLYELTDGVLMQTDRPLDGFGFLSGVFILCMSVLMIQIIETRILSVVSLYYMAFFSISMAMLGLTGGAPIVYFKMNNVNPRNACAFLSRISAAFALCIAVCFLLQLASPLPTVKWATFVVIWLKAILLLATPFVLGGIAVSVALTRSSFAVGIQRPRSGHRRRQRTSRARPGERCSCFPRRAAHGIRLSDRHAAGQCD